MVVINLTEAGAGAVLRKYAWRCGVERISLSIGELASEAVTRTELKWRRNSQQLSGWRKTLMLTRHLCPR
jgi:hypothetical protein